MDRTLSIASSPKMSGTRDLKGKETIHFFTVLDVQSKKKIKNFLD